MKGSIVEPQRGNIMTHNLPVTVGLGCALLYLALPNTTLAFAGKDPITAYHSCTFTRATAQLGPDGSIVHKHIQPTDG